MMVGSKGEVEWVGEGQKCVHGVRERPMWVFVSRLCTVVAKGMVDWAQQRL